MVSASSEASASSPEGRWAPNQKTSTPLPKSIAIPSGGTRRNALPPAWRARRSSAAMVRSRAMRCEYVINRASIAWLISWRPWVWPPHTEVNVVCLQRAFSIVDEDLGRAQHATRRVGGVNEVAPVAPATAVRAHRRAKPIDLVELGGLDQRVGGPLVGQFSDRARGPPRVRTAPRTGRGQPPPPKTSVRPRLASSHGGPVLSWAAEAAGRPTRGNGRAAAAPSPWVRARSGSSMRHRRQRSPARERAAEQPLADTA